MGNNRNGQGHERHMNKEYIMQRAGNITCSEIMLASSGFPISFPHSNGVLNRKSFFLTKHQGNFGSLRPVFLPNLKGSVGLILAKASDMRISILLDSSSRPFIPLPCFIRSRCPTPPLTPSLFFVLRVLPKRSILGVDLSFVGFSTHHVRVMLFILNR